jgi:aryl-alcohol dehydrogenase-like predicted oxidoreductase
MSTDAPPRLTLGTAQLGMAYGVANRLGRPSEAAARDIVAAAWAGGVRRFDTAMHYGESEAVLGRALTAIPGAPGAALVVGKLAPDLDPADAGLLERSVRATLDRLGLDALDGLLLHREALLDRWERLRPGLEALRAAGLTRRIGVSVYSPANALAALRLPGLDLLQAPSSVLDRRFEDAGVFAAAAEAGVAVQVRSVFLQGLLLLPADRLPGRMAFAAPYVRAFQDCCAEAGLSPARAALGYAWTAYPGAAILAGAESAAQVRDNLAHAAPLPPGLAGELRSRLRDVPEKVLNPSLWPSGGSAS